MQPLREWWGRQPRARRNRLGAGGAIAGLLAVILVTALWSHSSQAAPVQITAAIPTIEPATGTPGGSAPTPAPTDTGVPTLHTLKELKDRIGDPPDAKAGRFLIPRIGVDAPIGIRSVPASLQMAAPEGPSDVVLYDFAVAPRYGGKPGDGNAVFSGHVDYSYKLPYANANYTGQGVFFSLRLLTTDDEIRVVMGGRTLTYRVAWMRTVEAEGGDWGALLASDQGGDVITLVTCDGTFNPTTKEYNERTVVRAVRS